MSTLLRGLLWMGICVAFLPARAATIAMTGSDSSGNSSFNTGLNWTGGAAPTSGNDYTDTGYTLRTPAASGTFTFAGDSLTISGASLAYKGTGSSDVINIASLKLNGGIVTNLVGTTAFTLAGNITLLSSGGTFDLNGNDPTTVTANIGGTGALQIVNNSGSTQATNAVVLKGTDTYQGGTTIRSYAYLDVQADGGLGTGNLTMLGGTLKLDSGSTNNYVADTASVILSASLAAGAVNLSFSGSDTIAALSLDGGATYAAAGTWGSATSGAQHVSSLFTGSGVFNVVPEPGTWALLLLGGAALALPMRRTAPRPGAERA